MEICQLRGSPYNREVTIIEKSIADVTMDEGEFVCHLPAILNIPFYTEICQFINEEVR